VLSGVHHVVVVVVLAVGTWDMVVLNVSGSDDRIGDRLVVSVCVVFFAFASGSGSGSAAVEMESS
jgi:hypothetical protein